MSEDGELFSDLLTQWRKKWQAEPTSAHELRAERAERWVRFHSLPNSQRYPQNEAEYKVVLERHNAVLDELFTGRDVCVITTGWSDPGGADVILADSAGRDAMRERHRGWQSKHPQGL